MLFRNGSSCARMEKLESTKSDNLLISINCGGLRIVMTTTNVKLDNRDEPQRLIQGLDVCRKYVDSKRLDGVIFFGDYNARHFD